MKWNPLMRKDTATKRKRTTIITLGVGIALFSYASLPYVMGRAGAMSRVPPSWYVLPAWDWLYVFGWEDAGRDGKPRLPRATPSTD